MPIAVVFIAQDAILFIAIREPKVINGAMVSCIALEPMTKFTQNHQIISQLLQDALLCRMYYDNES